MKLRDGEVEVKYEDDEIVVQLDGRARQARILDWWRETGRWWEGEQEKEFLRVEAGGVYVLYRIADPLGSPGPFPSKRHTERWLLYAAED